jgi:hypothetical protein
VKNLRKIFIVAVALVSTMRPASADDYYEAVLGYGKAMQEIFVLALQDYVQLNDTIGQCTDVCVITSNDGGLVSEFKKAAEIVKRRNIRVKIDGKCYSACAVFADAARPQVCITKKAEFYFHLGTNYKNLPVEFSFAGASGEKRSWKLFTVSVPVSRFEPEQSPLIHDWIIKNGGFPASGFLKMNYRAAKSFWPMCL